MGEKAKPAARALCQAALDPSEKVRLAVLEALEKAHPALHKHLVTLLVDSQHFARGNAAKAIGAMGREGEPALPVLLGLAKRVTQIKVTEEGVALMGLHRGNEAEMRVLAREGPILVPVLEALEEIDGDNPEVIKTLIASMHVTPVYIDLRAVRQTAIAALGKIGDTFPAKRGELVAPLVEALDARLNRGRTPDDQTRIAAAGVLGRFGPVAKEAIPALKKLKLDPDMQVRDAAAAAIERINRQP